MVLNETLNKFTHDIKRVHPDFIHCNRLLIIEHLNDAPITVTFADVNKPISVQLTIQSDTECKNGGANDF